MPLAWTALPPAFQAYEFQSENRQTMTDHCVPAKPRILLIDDIPDSWRNRLGIQALA